METFGIFIISIGGISVKRKYVEIPDPLPTIYATIQVTREDLSSFEQVWWQDESPSPSFIAEKKENSGSAVPGKKENSGNMVGKKESSGSGVIVGKKENSGNMVGKKENSGSVVEKKENSGSVVEKKEISGSVVNSKTNTSMLAVPKYSDDSVMFNYRQASKEISLNEITLSELVSGSISISFYIFDNNSELNQQIGCLVFTFEELITKSVISGSFPFHNSKDQKTEQTSYLDNYQVEITVELDSHLAEYTTGCRILTVIPPVVMNVPDEWKVIPNSNPEEIKKSLADPLLNTSYFSLKTYFPLDNSLLDFVMLDGKVAYDVETNQWFIQWKEEKKKKFFLSKATVLTLEDKIEDHHQHYLVFIEKRVREKNTKLSDVWYMKSELDLSDLFEPGKVKTCVLGGILPGNLPSKEELTDLLNASTTTEAKKGYQEYLDNYDNLEVKAANQASITQSTTLQVQLEMNLNKPIIIPESEPLEPLLHVSDIIPPRPPFPPYPKQDASIAIQDEIKKIAQALLFEYNQYSSEQQIERDGEEKILDFRNYLNDTGKYHVLREQLKRMAVNLVQERYTLQNSENGNTMYAQLYTYLIGKVNTALCDIFTPTKVDECSQVETTSHPENSASHSGNTALHSKNIASHPENKNLMQLRNRAMESEASKNYNLSNTLHLEIICYVEEHALGMQEYLHAVWYEYALFYLRRREYSKAVECFVSCLSWSPNFLPALCSYGALLIEIKEFKEAKIILADSFRAKGENSQHYHVVGHALLGLYYDQMNNDKRKRMQKIEIAEAIKVEKQLTTTGVWITLASFLVKLNLVQSTERVLQLTDESLSLIKAVVLSKEQRLARYSTKCHLALKQNDFEKAVEYGNQATEIDEECSIVYFFLGKAYSSLGIPTKAISYLLKSLKSFDCDRKEYLLELYLLLGSIYLESFQWDAAKEIFLRACTEIPSASTWLGVGIACMRQENWKEAEEALSEANILDNMNAEVWGYLTLLCLSVSPLREEEANITYQQALRLNLNNAKLLREIGNAFVAKDKLSKAEEVFRLSILNQESSSTRKRLADVLLAQNYAESALREYQLALSSHQENIVDIDEHNIKCELLEKCAQLLVTLGKIDEANEYRGMIRKLKETIPDRIVSKE